jgi:outer membrane protein OmpA-like peptidoglycan-associated protein
MRKFLIYFSFLVLHSSFVFAQQYNTCDKAAFVNTSSFGPVNCSGAPDQLCSERNNGGLYFKEAHNVAWITFEAPKDTTLTFDIIPNAAEDDLDFLLFKEEEGGNFCSHLGVINNNDPVRTNLAKPSDNKGSTGLSRKATEKIVDKNGTSSYSKALQVKKGERYFLVVDDKTKAGAFTLALHLNFNEPEVNAVAQNSIPPNGSYTDANLKMVPPIQQTVKDTSPATPQVVVAPSKPTKTMLVVKVVDTAGNPVNAELDIDGITPNETTTINAAQDSFALDPLQTININCNAIGYVFMQANYIAPDSIVRKEITIRIPPIKANQSIVLKGIEFVEAKAELLPKSKAPLMNVVAFMRNNTKVKIMIKGYVNDPDGKNTGIAKQLSKDRAEAVFKFLSTFGISKSRMDYKGYGNKDMLFPNPINKEQEQANRRVEIEIK